MVGWVAPNVVCKQLATRSLYCPEQLTLIIIVLYPPNCLRSLSGPASRKLLTTADRAGLKQPLCHYYHEIRILRRARQMPFETCLDRVEAGLRFAIAGI